MAPLFNLGDEASQKELFGALEAVRTQGGDVLSQLDTARLETLVSFERRLSSMNGRRQRANRVAANGTIVKFVTSDFLDVDQALTTATLRCDANNSTLRERAVPTDAVVRTINFSTSSGTVESLGSSLYRVNALDGSRPTGTFDLELQTSINLTLMVFDIAPTPSLPKVQVQTSNNGINYTDVKSLAQNGYRINAWMTPALTRFVRLVITPAQADNLSGNSYTFGLTDFSATSLEFNLASSFQTLGLQFAPQTNQVRFVADDTDGLTYFLSLVAPGTAPVYIEVVPDQVLSLGGSNVSVSSVGMDINGVLQHTLAANLYLNTLKVVQNGGVAVPIAPGLQGSDPNLSKLKRQYIGVVGSTMSLLAFSGDNDTGKTFAVSYQTGPAVIEARLLVQFSTSNREVTPIFSGASLEQV